MAGNPGDDAFDALLFMPQAAARSGDRNHSAPGGFGSDTAKSNIIQCRTAMDANRIYASAMPPGPKRRSISDTRPDVSRTASVLARVP